MELGGNEMDGGTPFIRSFLLVLSFSRFFFVTLFFLFFLLHLFFSCFINKKKSSKKVHYIQYWRAIPNKKPNN